MFSTRSYNTESSQTSFDHKRQTDSPEAAAAAALEAKKTIRALELQVKESERRVRQRDQELERLRVKLQSLATKERETAVRHREALAAWRQGQVRIPTSSGSSTGGSGTGVTTSSSSSRPSPSSSPSSFKTARNNMSLLGAKKPIIATASAKALQVSFPDSRGSSTGHAGQTVTGAGFNPMDVIAALDAQREALEKRNEELNEQLADLSVALKSRANATPVKKTRSGAFLRKQEGSNTTSETAEMTANLSVLLGHHDPDTSYGDMIGGSGNGEITAEEFSWAVQGRDNMISTIDISRAGTAEGNDPAGGDGAGRHRTARAMYDVICQQKDKIAQLEARCEKWRSKVDEMEAVAAQLRAKVQTEQDVRSDSHIT